MNRISRRSSAESADALLEVGRTEPVLHYDVEVGLARHHHWLRSEAPLPEWASASVGAAAKSMVPVIVKTFVSVVLMGTFAAAAWQARGRLQPSAAEVQRASLAAESAPVAPPTAAEEAKAPIPMPVSSADVTSDAPTRGSAHADATDKRSRRLQRARKEVTTVRAASVAAAPHAEPEPTESLARATEEPTTRAEVVVPERKPNSATQAARPEPAPRAQGPDDMLEMQQVATAEQLLARSPGRALALVRQGDQRFARGYFQQERAYIAIMALIRLGRIDEARARAASFAQHFPALPYGARIRSALDAAR